MLDNKNWVLMLVASTLAIALAAVGLFSTTYGLSATPLLTTGLLVASLASTATAFGALALRVRRLELENMGLIEEISQEFDRVKDRMEIYAEALASEPAGAKEAAQTVTVDEPAARRVTVK